MGYDLEWVRSGRRLLEQSAGTGWWGVPGYAYWVRDEPKIHLVKKVVGNREIPLCHTRVHPEAIYQFCALSVVPQHVTCAKCRRMLEDHYLPALEAWEQWYDACSAYLKKYGGRRVKPPEKYPIAVEVLRESFSARQGFWGAFVHNR